VIRRGTLILAVSAAAGLVLLAATRTWATGRLPDGGSVTVTGGTAVPAVPALALAAAAAAVALSLAGRWSRPLLAGAIVVTGGGIAALAAAAAMDPAGVLRPAVVAATGVSGTTVAAASSPWCWPAVVAGLGIALCGLGALRAGRGWSAVRRIDQPAGQGIRTRDAWHALDDGVDPTHGGDLPE